jgi:Tfp pilus assembly protein PilN
MAQQINLSTPILLAQKRYFSANTMAMSLGVFLVLGGALCAAWVWNFARGTARFDQSVAEQAVEITTLKAVIASAKANAAPVDPALLEQLQQVHNTVEQREKLQLALQEGLLRPGWGHSDRLNWVASSIPATVWVTDVKLNGVRFEVTGFTLEPAALNEWVDKLAVSPLMQGLKLSTVRVEKASPLTAGWAAAQVAAASAPRQPPRATWAFNLVSAEPPAPTASEPSGAQGSRP